METDLTDVPDIVETRHSLRPVNAVHEAGGSKGRYAASAARQGCLGICTAGHKTVFTDGRFSDAGRNR